MDGGATDLEEKAPLFVSCPCFHDEVTSYRSLEVLSGDWRWPRSPILDGGSSLDSPVDGFLKTVSRASLGRSGSAWGRSAICLSRIEGIFAC